MGNHKYALASQEVQAIYTQVAQKLYQDNPLIEALPENCSEDDYINNLTVKIPFDWNEEKELPSYDRLDCTQQIYSFFQPWSTHIKLAQSVSQAIRSGYQGRNPLKPEEIKKLREIAGCLQAKDPSFSRLAYTNTSAAGFFVIGYSGTGKTSAMQHVLELFPQKINHSEYHGIDFPYAQLVWLKLDCPFDGSVRGLCGQFFAEFDRVMGDNTYSRFAGRRTATTDLMIPQMALLAERHGLGMLVIDEIQNLNAAKSNGTEKMLNFITDLINKIGVPVVLMGTDDAINVINDKMMNVRRSLGQQGAIAMDLFDKNTDDWILFVKKIWKYQWTSVQTPLTQDIMDALYENSNGLVFAVVWLFAEAQRVAIQLGTSERQEIITSELIKQLADSSSYKMLKAKLMEIRTAPKKSKCNNTSFSKDEINYSTHVNNHINVDKSFAQVLEMSENSEVAKKVKSKSSSSEIPDLSGSILKKDRPY